MPKTRFLLKIHEINASNINTRTQTRIPSTEKFCNSPLDGNAKTTIKTPELLLKKSKKPDKKHMTLKKKPIKGIKHDQKKK